MRWRLTLLAALPLVVSRLGAASDVLVPRGPAAPADYSSMASSGLGPSTWALAFVLAAAGAWLLWRNRRRSGGQAAKGKLSVAETRSLGNRQYLVVASYGKQKFLIGVCVGNISLLAPLSDEDNPQAR